MKIKLKKVNDSLKEKLRDPYFKELYELEQQKTLLVKKIIDYRMKNDLTQEELAFKSDLTLSQIGRIERGMINTTVSTILVIAKALNIHPKELLSFTYES